MIVIGLLLPLLGTTIGSLMALLFKKNVNQKIFDFLNGFAGGVMVAASIWSLLIPCIDMTTIEGVYKILPATIGFVLGMICLSYFDNILSSKNINMLNFAVILHNIPEGFCVGCALSAIVNNNYELAYSALILSLGISIQNIPEGSIISLNMLKDNSKKKSIIVGILSGVVEPVSSILAIVLVYFIKPLLPFTLSFAAGSMIYVVINELIPSSRGKECNYGFCCGFVIMMILDILY